IGVGERWEGDKRMTQNGQRHRYVRASCGALLLAVWALLGAGFPVEAQSPRYRVAVLTPGGAFSPALEGFREGVTQLGYQEGKNLTLIVEDAQGEEASLATRDTQAQGAHP